MNQIFADLKDTFIILYLDDILIYSKNEAQPTDYVHIVLNRLRDNHFFAKPEKCSFDLQQLDFLNVDELF